MRTGDRPVPAFAAFMLLAASILSLAESGSARAAILGSHVSDRTSLTLGGTLYFAAQDGTHGSELWRSDGTKAGTVMVKDIQPGRFGSSPYSFTAVGGTLYFDAYDSTHGDELWRSDGTEAGTYMVKDISPGAGDSNIFLANPTNVGGTLVFTANDGVHGQELWRSDGTANGTVTVRDIRPGPGSSDPLSLTEANGTVFFTARDGIHGRELWRSDGTMSGTVMVRDLWPGSVGGLRGYGPTFDPVSLTSVGGSVFFNASDGPDRVLDLWTSDGSTGGTVLLLETEIRPARGDPLIYEMAGVGETLYFAMKAPNDDAELWKSDGTPSGTVDIGDVLPGVYWVFSLGSLTDFGGTLYFDGASHLWKSDGTAEGTVAVKPIPPAYRLRPPMVPLGNNLYFSATDIVHGPELWTSDGTAGGTVMVKDISPGSRGSGPGYFADVEGTAYFVADDRTSGPELWRSDGTKAGTVMVKDINPGSKGSSPSNLIFVPA